MSGNSFEPESLAELTRFVTYMMSGIDRQLTELFNKVDKLDVVSKEQYREDFAAMKQQQREDNAELREEIREVSKDLEGFQSRLSAHGRWLIGSIIFPLVGLILTIYGLLHGIKV